MAKEIKTIGVLTSGGDAPGMNAAIRAVVRRGLGKGIRMIGIERGYEGLLNEELRELTARDVSDTIGRGGTFLGTARCSEMRTKEGQERAAEICRKHGIEGLVVIGGDGSFAGAQKLANLGINTVGLLAPCEPQCRTHREWRFGQLLPPALPIRGHREGECRGPPQCPCQCPSGQQSF